MRTRGIVTHFQIWNWSDGIPSLTWLNYTQSWVLLNHVFEYPVEIAFLLKCILTAPNKDEKSNTFDQSVLGHANRYFAWIHFCGYKSGCVWSFVSLYTIILIHHDGGNNVLFYFFFFFCRIRRKIRPHIRVQVWPDQIIKKKKNKKNDNTKPDR